MVDPVKMKISLPPNLPEHEAVLLFAIKLYEVGRVSTGQAAKLMGLSKLAFIEMLGRYRVPIFNYSPEELRERHHHFQRLPSGSPTRCADYLEILECGNLLPLCIHVAETQQIWAAEGCARETRAVPGRIRGS
jgi:predicted HTH domain antitoxin